MSYFVFKIIPVGETLVKNLELLEEFELFPKAKKFARQIRQQQDGSDNIKIIFAENRLVAEEQLLEKREATIVREWEK